MTQHIEEAIDRLKQLRKVGFGYDIKDEDRAAIDAVLSALAAAEERGRIKERERCQEKQEHPIVGADRVYKVLKKYRDEGRFDWDHIGYICRDVAAITKEPTP